nr:30S ribosomal protein S18 [Myxococcota bacterium]
RPPRDDRPPREDRGGYRDRDDRPPRGPMGIKQRLRAKARKKARKQRRKMGFERRRGCRFCAEPELAIDYKDSRILRSFVSETGKLIPRRVSGNCARHQRQVQQAIQRSRQLAFLPYSDASL